MNYRLNALRLLAITVSLVAVFQNCGQATFTRISTLTSAKVSTQGTSDLSVPDPTPTPCNTEIDPLCNISPSPTPTPSPTPSPSPSPSVDDDGDLVECELASPNTKVTLSEIFQPGSNAEQSRICMSSNACLNLINLYASQRGGSLSVGAPSHASNGPCTAIFPGSQGTCKNARALSDAEVASILSDMANRK